MQAARYLRGRGIGGQQGGGLGGQHLGDAAHGQGQGRHAAGHGFEQHQSKAFAGGRVHVERAGVQQRGHGRALAQQQNHVLQAGGRYLFPQRHFVGSLPGQGHHKILPVSQQLLRHGHQKPLIFAGFQVAHVQ